jgi:ribosome-associated protein
LSHIATSLMESPLVSDLTSTRTQRDLPDALQRACLAAKTAFENKAEDVMILDLTEITPVFDYFVIATGQSRRQVHTLVEEIDATMRGVGDERMHLTGYESSRWVVQDYGDVVCHVFDAETRAYYNLEDLWADAEKLDWREEIE